MLKLWRLQNLTLEGRITTSKIIHLALVKTIPNATIDQLSKMQKDFTLNKMKWKIKNSILHSNLHDGGLINDNIKSKIISFQGAWVILQYLQLFITNMHDWKILDDEIVIPFFSHVLWILNCGKKYKAKYICVTWFNTATSNPWLVISESSALHYYKSTLTNFQVSHW